MFGSVYAPVYLNGLVVVGARAPFWLDRVALQCAHMIMLALLISREALPTTSSNPSQAPSFHEDHHCYNHAQHALVPKRYCRGTRPAIQLFIALARDP